MSFDGNPIRSFVSSREMDIGRSRRAALSFADRPPWSSLMVIEMGSRAMTVLLSRFLSTVILYNMYLHCLRHARESSSRPGQKYCLRLQTMKMIRKHLFHQIVIKKRSTTFLNML